MKRFLSTLCVIAALVMTCSLATAQKNYPVITNQAITDIQGGMIDPNGLPEAGQVRFNVSIINFDELQVVKAGSCEIKIELGHRLKLPENANLAKAPLSEYFTWSLEKSPDGNNYLYGKLKTDLPANFEGVAFFSLQCKGTGSSQVKTHLLYDVEKLNNNGINSVAFTIIPKAGGNSKN